MPRPPLPGTVWVPAKVKLTEDQFLALRAESARAGKTRNGIITEAVLRVISKVPSKTVRSYVALRGGDGSRKPPPKKGGTKTKSKASKRKRVGPPPPTRRKKPKR